MSFPEYCSESDGIVIEDSAIGFADRSGEGDDILIVNGEVVNWREYGGGDECGCDGR